MNAGDITYHFTSDTKSLDKDLNSVEKKVSSTGNSIKNIVAGLGITSIISNSINTITSSLDGAIKRVDTLNQFPKIMSLFGVSAEEASASIKRIDKSVQGLPTSLDTAVAGVQDLFTVTQNLKESEQLFKSVNDAAMVFASGSTDAVNRFIYAYKQSLSMGKVQAEEFNQMNEAIPGLMTKVAESMGISYGELKDGLSDGTISIDNFNETLKKLDTEGTTSMTSLSDSAKSATGGIGTSFTNMKTAVTRGVGNVITSINEMLTNSGLPDIQGIIQSATTTINNVFTTLSNVISNIDLSKIINILSTLKQIAPAILPIVSSIIAYKGAVAGIKTISSIFSGVSKAVSFGKTLISLIPSINGVKSALMLLNVAFNLNPIGVVVGLIVGLVTAFILLWNKCEGFRNFWTGLWDGIKSVFSTVINAIIGFFTTTIPNTINAFIEFFKNLPYNIGLLLGQLLGFFVQLGVNLFNWVTTNVPQIISNIVNFFKELPGKIWDNLVKIATKVAEALSKAKDKAVEGAKKIFNAIVDKLKKLPGEILDIGKNLVKGLWNGITGMADWIKKKIKKFASGIVDGFKNALGIHSPSKLTYEMGIFLDKGFINGMDDMQPEIQRKIDGMFNLSPSLYGSATNNLSPSVNIVNNVNVEQDPLGQMVQKIKTFSGGAKNDYNYGMGV